MLLPNPLGLIGPQWCGELGQAAGRLLRTIGFHTFEFYGADSWKVNFDHGHHVNGTLSFPLEQVKNALTDGAKVELTVAQPDGSSPAVFTWDSAK